MDRSLIVIAIAVLSPAVYADGESDAEARAGIALSVAGTDAQQDGNTGQAVAAAWLTHAAEVRYDNSSSFIRGSAQVAMRAGSDGVGISIEQEATARPYAFEMFQLELADRLGFDVQPKLSDRPDRWRRRYSHAGFDFNVIGLQYIGSWCGVQFIRVDNGADWEVQHDGTANDRRHTETADWSPLSITRRKQGVEVARFDPIVLEARAISGARSGVVMTTFAPRITGIPLGIAHLDLAFGQAATGWTQTTIDGEVVSTITSEQLPPLRVPATRARLATSFGRFDASLGGERGMYLAMDATLVVEQRATAMLAMKLGDTTLIGTGFAAHSVIWTSKTDSSEHVTGGGSLALDFDVGDRWRLSNKAELARTFYASTEGERLPHVDTALRIDVALRHEIKNWVKR